MPTYNHFLISKVLRVREPFIFPSHNVHLATTSETRLYQGFEGCRFFACCTFCVTLLHLVAHMRHPLLQLCANHPSPFYKHLILPFAHLKNPLFPSLHNVHLSQNPQTIGITVFEPLQFLACCNFAPLLRQLFLHNSIPLHNVHLSQNLGSLDITGFEGCRKSRCCTFCATFNQFR